MPFLSLPDCAMKLPLLVASAAVLVFASALPLRAESLAEQAVSILENRCAHCHGGDGNSEGGFNYVTNVNKLIARNRLKPGKPAGSKLLQLIASGDMPADADMPAADLALLEKWVKAGAPAVQTAAPAELLTPQRMYKLLDADLNQQPAASRRFVRYFSLAHYSSGGATGEELTLYRQALSKLVNSLSWGVEIAPPVAIDAQQLLFRIDLRDYQWTPQTWERILKDNPYQVTYRTDAAASVRRATETSFPVLRADWFAATASVPPLYHDILQIPTSEKKLEEMVKLNTAQNIADFQVVRAGFNGSGVSRNNRMIERHETQYGAYWKSYDFSGNSGDKNLFSRPLGPAGKNAFVHDGGEIIFHQPNGLQGYMLTDAQGARIDKGPTAIVSDPRRPDRAVVNGLSCMTCHVRGTIKKDDQIRASVLRNLNLFDNFESQQALTLYPKNEIVQAKLAEDSQRFLNALQQAGGGDGDTKTEPVGALVERFEQEVDLQLAAAETGMTTTQFLRALDAAPEVALPFGPLRAPGGTVQREVFLSSFAKFAAELGLDREFELNSLQMKMLAIRGGSFNMGTSPTDALFQNDEGPQRTRRVQPFYMSDTEVTVGQFQQFVDETGHRGLSGYQFDAKNKQFVQNRAFDWRNPGFEQTDNHPVVNISRNDAIAFCKWLSDKDGVTYRLPTETEWEYACRAGAQSRYSFGDKPEELAGRGNVADKSLQQKLGYGDPWSDGHAFTAEVRSFPANAFGLFDMHGNVFEWCSGQYTRDYRNASKKKKADAVGVARGGSWATTSEAARAAQRLALAPGSRTLFTGFRIVRSRNRTGS